MADAWFAATCARLDELHTLFAADAQLPMGLIQEAERTVRSMSAPWVVNDPAHRHELLRKLSRLAAVLSDGPRILRLVRAPQPEASGAGQAVFMVCTALQAYCAAVQGCGELADAIWEPSSSETLQQLLVSMAALLVGPCLDELEAASRAMDAGPGAAAACTAAANLQDTLCEIAGLVLLTRCGSEAMAAAIVTPNPRRLAHFLFAVNSLLISPGLGQLAPERSKRVIVQAACSLPYALLLPHACSELQQLVAADLPLQRTIVQLVLTVTLPHAAVAVAQAEAGERRSSGSSSSVDTSGGGMPSVWPTQRQPVEENLWFDVGATLNLLACPCLGGGLREVLLPPSSGSGGRHSGDGGSSDCSPALLQAIKLAASTARHLPATRPVGVDGFVWRQLHAGALAALGVLCGLLPPTSASQQQQPEAAVDDPGSRHQQSMAAVAAAVPALVASLRQVVACREADASAGGAAALMCPLSQLCGALECCLVSLEGMHHVQLSTRDLQSLLTDGTTALRLLPLLLVQPQQQELGAAEGSAEGAAAAAARLAQRCLQTALLAGTALNGHVVIEVARGLDQPAEQIPEFNAVVSMIQLMHQAAMPLQPQVDALHAAVCRLLAWQRSAGGPAVRGLAGDSWHGLWSLLETLLMNSFAKPGPCYPGVISRNSGTIAAHNCTLLAAVLDNPGTELLQHCLRHLDSALIQGADEIYGTMVVHVLEAALSRLSEGGAPLPPSLAVEFLSLMDSSALVCASLACSGWLPRLAQAALQSVPGDSSSVEGSGSGEPSGDSPSELLGATLERLLRKLVAAGQTCEEARDHVAVLLQQLSCAASAPAAERPAQLCQLLQLPALRSLAEAVAAEHSAPAKQEEVQLELAEEAATRTSCGYLLCPNLEAPEKGRLCKGCHTVRYCSQACAALDWRESAPGCPGHRRVCRLLAAQREAAE